MLRQTVVRKIQERVEKTALSWVDFECTSGLLQEESSLVRAVRVFADAPHAGGRSAFSIKYRPLPEFHLTYLASSDGEVEVRCSPSPRSSLKEDSFKIPWIEGSVLNTSDGWLQALVTEVGAHGLLRSEQEAIDELLREVEAKLGQIEETSGEKISEERISPAELSGILERIADLERELQARIAQQGLDDATRDKRIGELASEVEKLRFSVAVYTRRGLAATLVRLVLKFGRHAGDVAALADVAVKLLGP